jgi:hypothetical protein
MIHPPVSIHQAAPLTLSFLPVHTSSGLEAGYEFLVD